MNSLSCCTKSLSIYVEKLIFTIGNNGHTSINLKGHSSHVIHIVKYERPHRHLIAFEVVTKDWNLFIVRPTAFRASIDFHFSVQLGRLFVQLGKFSVQLQCFLIIEGLLIIRNY